MSDSTKETITHTSTPKYTYATLMETNGEECESWLYFIRYQGNEKALSKLNSQLDQVEWYVMDDYSTFDLEMKYLVCEQTAKDMTKIDVNHTSYHRKFDGKMKDIDLKFRSKDPNERKIKRVFKAIGYGHIEEYVDGEDIDPEDLATHSETETETESDSEDVSSEEKKDTRPIFNKRNKKKARLPPSAISLIKKLQEKNKSDAETV